MSISLWVTAGVIPLLSPDGRISCGCCCAGGTSSSIEIVSLSVKNSHSNLDAFTVGRDLVVLSSVLFSPDPVIANEGTVGKVRVGGIVRGNPGGRTVGGCNPGGGTGGGQPR